MQTSKFLKDRGLIPTRPALYQLDPVDEIPGEEGWSWVFIGELAQCIKASPKELLERYASLGSPGEPHWVQFMWVSESNPRSGQLHENGAVSSDEYDGKSVHPNMLVPAGFSQSVIKCWNADIYEVKWCKHEKRCSRGTICCCESILKYPGDLIGILKSGALYDGTLKLSAKKIFREAPEIEV